MSGRIQRVEGPMALGDALARAINQPGTMIQPPGHYLLRFSFTALGELCVSPEAVCGCKFTYFRDVIRGKPNRWYIVEEVTDSPEKLQLTQEVEGLKSALAELEKRVEALR